MLAPALFSIRTPIAFGMAEAPVTVGADVVPLHRVPGTDGTVDP